VESLAPVAFAIEEVERRVNPLHWDSGAYLALIVGLLLLRLLVPWSDSGLARFLEEVCLILPAGLFYFFVRGLEKSDASVAEAHAERIVSIERSMGIFVEPQLQARIIDHPILIDLANWVYIWAHWPVILGWVFWMWFRHRDDYPVYRNAILLSGAAGMVVFALYPTAPPRLMPELGFVDTISLRSHSYRVLQPPALADLYASMPSLHFGWNLLVGIAIARHAISRLGRAIGFLLPIAMFSAIVLTANHYLLDGIVGGAFPLTGLALSVYLTPRWAPALGHYSSGRRAPAQIRHTRAGGSA
jgi:PAP2 superfamily